MAMAHYWVSLRMDSVLTVKTLKAILEKAGAFNFQKVTKGIFSFDVPEEFDLGKLEIEREANFQLQINQSFEITPEHC